MTIHSIESFEMVVLRDDGEILINTNYEPELSYPDEGEVPTRIKGLDLIVLAPVPFRLVGAFAQGVVGEDGRQRVDAGAVEEIAVHELLHPILRIGWSFTGQSSCLGRLPAG